MEERRREGTEDWVRPALLYCSRACACILSKGSREGTSEGGGRSSGRRVCHRVTRSRIKSASAGCFCLCPLAQRAPQPLLFSFSPPIQATEDKPRLVRVPFLRPSRVSPSPSFWTRLSFGTGKPFDSPIDRQLTAPPPLPSPTDNPRSSPPFPPSSLSLSRFALLSDRPRQRVI